jgi:hypothetical protein
MRIMLASRLTLDARILLPLLWSVGDVITVAPTRTPHKLATTTRYAIHSCFHGYATYPSRCISLQSTFQRG